MAILALIKAVATGIKGNRDLTPAEAHEAIKAILHRTIAPEQIGALLAGWRVKLETPEELNAAYDALTESFSPLEKHPNSVEIAYNIGGKSKNIPLSFLSASLLPEIPIVLSTTAQRFDKTHTLHELAEYAPKNVLLPHVEQFAPKLAALSELRANLGIRTVFNTLEKLLNPYRSDYAIIGAHHGPYFEKYAALYKARYRHLLVVQGDEGSGEIIGRSKIHTYIDGTLLSESILDPNEGGIEFIRPNEAITLEQMRAKLTAPSEELVKLARLNAALIAYLQNPDKKVWEYYEML